MKTYLIELTGNTPLMHHRMSEKAQMELLFKNKEKKKKVKDDTRTPRDIAQEAVYQNDDGTYYIPSGYLRGAFSHCAGDYKQTSSKKSYKAIAGGVFIPTSDRFTLLHPETNKPIDNFEVQIDKGCNRNMGKGTAVIICRPRFDKWKIKATVMIDNDLISPEMTQQIVEDSGRRSGIGSFRVSNGGTYGMYSVTQFKEINDSDLK